MIEKLDIFVSKLAEQQTIRALRRGLLYLMPLIIIGSIVLALISLPIPAYQNFMVHVFGMGWKELGLSIHKCTLQIMAILTLITVSYTVSKEMEITKSGEVNSIIIIITTFSSFFAFTDHTDMMISEKVVGSSGLFQAIVISVIACNLFCFFYKCRDRLLPPDIVHFNGSALIRVSFRAVVPALLTILFFCVAKTLAEFTGLNGIQAVLFQWINETWMTGHNYFSALLIIFITHVLWFFGIHGGNVVMDAISGATPVGSTAILTKGFFDTYVYLGGAGATVGLLVALLLTRKKAAKTNWQKFLYCRPSLI